MEGSRGISKAQTTSLKVCGWFIRFVSYQIKDKSDVQTAAMQWLPFYSSLAVCYRDSLGFYNEEHAKI